MRQIKVKCFNIKWDTDGKKIRLPKEVTLEIEVEDDASEDEIDDQISDALSDKVCFCHLGFETDRDKP